jgi:hypothetical protein
VLIALGLLVWDLTYSVICVLSNIDDSEKQVHCDFVNNYTCLRVRISP